MCISQLYSWLQMLQWCLLMVKLQRVSPGRQGVDDVEMFECRINAMQTIGIKKEDLTQAPAEMMMIDGYGWLMLANDLG